MNAKHDSIKIDHKLLSFDLSEQPDHRYDLIEIGCNLVV